MSSTDINPDPNILKRHVPLPNIYNKRQGYLNLHQVSSTFVVWRLGSPRLFQQTPRQLKLLPTDAADPWNIVNRRQGFQTWNNGSSGAVWNIDTQPSSDTLVGSTVQLNTQNIVSYIFYILVSRAPFYDKINVGVDFCLSVFSPQLTPSIKPSTNYLDTTPFS